MSEDEEVLHVLFEQKSTDIGSFSGHAFDEDEEEVLFEQKSTDNGSLSGHDFDEIVGFLENILVDEPFRKMQDDFFKQHAGKW